MALSMEIKTVSPREKEVGVVSIGFLSGVGGIQTWIV